ncbi:MAG: hypothetical protein JXA68_00010 [Ignavibacteriales bacterium]|nr:hypothetical protein [Ignavibacteriales bacterium]
MVVDFEDLTGIPKEFIIRLKCYESIFMEYDFLEHFQDVENIHQLINEINDYCLDNKIIGYHYTNGFVNGFKEKGILVRSGKEIRQEFVERHFHLFTKEEQNQILDKWEKRFEEEDQRVRDNCVFFNFTKDALKNSGAELLLKYYGGEQIYFPIFQIPEIGKKLEKIGIPLILRCKLNPNVINTFIEYPWGKIAVSRYHRKVNPEAHQIDQDGYQYIGVHPEDIEIIKYNIL